MKTRLTKVILSSMVLATSFSAINMRANVLLSESFNYSDGDLVTVSGGLWADNSGTTVTTLLNVSSGQAIITYANKQDDARAFTGTGSGVLYYGFDATISSVPGTTGSYIAALWDGESGVDTDYFARLQVAQGSTTSKVKFGVLNDNGNPVVYSGSEFDLNTTVRIVIGFDFSTMTPTLWINPTNASSPSVTDSVAAIFNGSATTVGNVLLRQTTGIGTTAVDNLVVATTFSEVAAVP